MQIQQIKQPILTRNRDGSYAVQVVNRAPALQGPTLLDTVIDPYEYSSCPSGTAGNMFFVWLFAGIGGIILGKYVL